MEAMIHFHGQLFTAETDSWQSGMSKFSDWQTTPQSSGSISWWSCTYNISSSNSHFHVLGRNLTTVSYRVENGLSSTADFSAAINMSAF